MGHHIQTLLELERVADGFFQRHKESEVDLLIEFQADCLAGFAIAKMKSTFIPGEIENMRKFLAKIHYSGSKAIGDLRVHWFNIGFASDSALVCSPYSMIL